MPYRSSGSTRGSGGRVISRRITALLVVLAVFAAGGATLAGPFADAARVAAANYDVVADPNGDESIFFPDSLTIDEGDKVVVFHPAGSLHNINWNDPPWNGALNPCPGDPTVDAWTCERRFNNPGRFKAICDIHPDMTLTVRVLAGPTPEPPPATPKQTKKPTPAPTKTPAPKPTPLPTVPQAPSPPPIEAPTASPTASATPTATPTAPATPAGTSAPVPTGTSSGDGAGPLLLLLVLVIGGALGGGALLRRRAAARGSSRAE